MPFTDEQPFLDAIFARYQDDGPRFIYADFLDDAGEPERAELVRVQVALSRMTEDDSHHANLKNQEAELLETHLAQWSEHLSDLDLEQCEFRRGVLDSIVINAATFLDKGEELLRRVCVRRLRLRDSAAVMPKLVNSQLLANVRELDLCGDQIGNGGVNLLVRSQFLKNLDLLDLGFTGIDDTGVTTLARASTLPKLSCLSLSANGQITSAGIMELAGSPFFGGLTSLDVFGNEIDEVGLSAIASSKILTSLHTLRLSRNHLGNAGMAVLARSSLFERMLSQSSRLEIRKNEIGPSGIAALAECPLLSRCTSLDVSNNEIGDTGLSALVKSPHLQNLKVLKVSHNHVTDAGIEKLREYWPRVFGQLQIFDISENMGLTRIGCRILEHENKGGSTVLDTSGNGQPSAGGVTPISGEDLVQGGNQGVSEIEEAERLRRRVSHPAMRGQNRPNPHG